MPTTPYNEEVKRGWRVLLHPLYKVFNLTARRGAGTRMSSVDLWADNLWWDENHKLREAVLALRMVAISADECYEHVAARVNREAARHEEFRRNPCAIGKICLNTKLIPPDKGGGRFVTQMYQVRDPAEGQASVSYTFPCSDRLVLEFFAHDENDNPLFPIARTYSNWIGTRKFDLGLGRTFTLKMTEGDCPDLVRVQAGFASGHADEVERYDADTSARGLPLAAYVAGGGASGTSNTFCRAPERSPAYMRWALALSLVVTAGLFCLTLLRSTAGRAHERPTDGRILGAAPALYPTTLEFVTFGGDGPDGLAGAEARNTNAMVNKPRAAFRDAVASGSSPAVIKSDGRRASGRCDELVANLRKAVGDMLRHMALPANYTGERGAAQAPDKLADVFFGRVSVTFYRRDGLLKVEDAGCLGSGGGYGVDFTVGSQAAASGLLTKPLREGDEMNEWDLTDGEEAPEQGTKRWFDE